MLLSEETQNKNFKANKSFWSDLIGYNSFYYELAIQIVEISISSRNKNGGLLPLETLKECLLAFRANDISE